MNSLVPLVSNLASSLRLVIIGFNLLLLFVVVVIKKYSNLAAWSKHLLESLKLKKSAVLFVVAHPDDEAMFMTPTISTLIRHQIPVYILCLSTGNADKLGKIRIQEFTNSVTHLKITNQSSQTLTSKRLFSSWDEDDWNETDLQTNQIRAFLIDNEEHFSDGLHSHWKPQQIVKELHSLLQKLPTIDTIFTFDAQGISQHPNHIAVYNGVKQFVQTHKTFLNQSYSAYGLRSESLFWKYLGIVNVMFTTEKQLQSAPNGSQYLFVAQESFFDAHFAMQQHASQYVWFRKLFTFFSVYSVLNKWYKIGVFE